MMVSHHVHFFMSFGRKDPWHGDLFHYIHIYWSPLLGGSLDGDGSPVLLLGKEPIPTALYCHITSDLPKYILGGISLDTFPIKPLSGERPPCGYPPWAGPIYTARRQRIYIPGDASRICDCNVKTKQLVWVLIHLKIRLESSRGFRLLSRMCSGNSKAPVI